MAGIGRDGDEAGGQRFAAERLDSHRGAETAKAQFEADRAVEQ